VGKKLSTETNFSGQLCRSERALFDFASQISFPSHGLILRDNEGSNNKVFKGITDKATLLKKFQTLLDLYGSAFAETDMRALYNPTRMKVIGEATDAMLEKALIRCEQCNTPGFGITGTKPGLLCQLCGLPTRSIMAFIYSCSSCNFTMQEPNPQKLFEEPMYCDYCNP